MPLDYMNPSSFRPRRKPPWRAIAITFVTIFAAFMFLCSGLSFPIIGGASRDLANKLHDDFAVGLPASAVVERGARIAYVDPSYCFVMRMATSDILPFISSIRDNKKAADTVQDTPRFSRSAPPPPNWFDPNSVPDLVSFDVHFHSTSVWHWGYSPSTGRIYVRRDSL